jgi:hypothetical protein
MAEPQKKTVRIEWNRLSKLAKNGVMYVIGNKLPEGMNLQQFVMAVESGAATVPDYLTDANAWIRLLRYFQTHPPGFTLIAMESGFRAMVGVPSPDSAETWQRTLASMVWAPLEGEAVCLAILLHMADFHGWEIAQDTGIIDLSQTDEPADDGEEEETEKEPPQYRGMTTKENQRLHAVPVGAEPATPNAVPPAYLAICGATVMIEVGEFDPYTQGEPRPCKGCLKVLEDHGR